MAIENVTPYPHFDSISLDKTGRAYRFCVLRATFDLTDSKFPQLCKDQRPPILVDEYLGDARSSSLRVENDLSPFKPNAEVYFVDPIARVPAKCPQKSWLVTIRVGAVLAKVRVVGERSWRRTITGRWALNDPEPTESVKISFENAYGGSNPSDSADYFAENPVGCGAYANTDASQIRAPQIEAIHAPISTPGNKVKIAGLTPVHRGWLPRRALCGTFDDEWRSKKWPLAPDDYTEAFNNCAPLHLQCGRYFQGDEEVHLDGIGPHIHRKFRLPESRKPVLLLLNRRGIVYQANFVLDTVVFELEKNLVSLVWRSAFSTPEPVDVERLQFH